VICAAKSAAVSASSCGWNAGNPLPFQVCGCFNDCDCGGDAVCIGGACASNIGPNECCDNLCYGGGAAAHDELCQKPGSNTMSACGAPFMPCLSTQDCVAGTCMNDNSGTPWPDGEVTWGLCESGNPCPCCLATERCNPSDFSPLYYTCWSEDGLDERWISNGQCQ
jgi:hypothetical protein